MKHLSTYYETMDNRIYKNGILRDIDKFLCKFKSNTYWLKKKETLQIESE